MATLDTLGDLLQFVLQRQQTIVFGNLGRYPQVLYNGLAAIPQLDVAVKSPHYIFPASPDNRIRVVRPQDPLERCDLLVLIEPTPSQIIEKPPTANRIVVFTSHLVFKTRPEDLWVHASFFHSFDLCKMAKSTRHLLDLQDGSLQSRDAKQVHIGQVNTLFVSGRNDAPINGVNTYVVIDLTRQSTELGMYLAFWDAFDFLLDNADSVHRWLICFPEKDGRRKFVQFKQKCLDKLFCLQFEHGNVTKVADVLALLPFYQSGTIDRKFNLPTYSFGGIPYVAPRNAEEACKAAVKYNLEHWVGNLYRIVE